MGPPSNIVLYYIPCIYVPRLPVKDGVKLEFFICDKDGLSSVKPRKLPRSAGNGTKSGLATRFQASGQMECISRHAMWRPL